MSQGGTEPRDTGRTWGGREQKIGCTCVCMCLGFSCPNRDMRNHNITSSRAQSSAWSQPKTPNSSHYHQQPALKGHLLCASPVLGLPWSCPGSREAKSDGASPNPEGPLAAHHPSSFAWLEFITIFLFGSQGSNLCGVEQVTQTIYNCKGPSDTPHRLLQHNPLR